MPLYDYCQSVNFQMYCFNHSQICFPPHNPTTIFLFPLIIYIWFDSFNTLLLTLTWVIFTQSELIMSTIHYKSFPDSPKFRIIKTDLPGGSSGKEPTYQCRRHKRYRLNLWVRKIPLEKGMTTHSNNLAWEIPWTEKPDKVSDMTKAT